MREEEGYKHRDRRTSLHAVKGEPEVKKVDMYSNKFATPPRAPSKWMATGVLP